MTPSPNKGDHDLLGAVGLIHLSSKVLPIIQGTEPAIRGTQPGNCRRQAVQVKNFIQHADRSGRTPNESRAFTECCVGLVFCPLMFGT